MSNQQFLFIFSHVLTASYKHRSDTLCVTQTLTDAQTDLGTISLDSIVTMVSNGTTIPSSVICTDCVQEAYNILSENFPSYASQAESSVESECGSSFVGAISIPFEKNSRKKLTSIGFRRRDNSI